MKVVIASDHAGFKFKEALKPFLSSLKIDLSDLGTKTEDSCDYTDYAKAVSLAVQKGSADMGILICGSGIGMCMTANRFKGVRAAVINDEFDAEMSRRHNNANVACFGSRKLNIETIKRFAKLWLATPFEGGRHEKRVKKID